MTLPAAPIVDSAPPAIKTHPSIVDSVVLATDARRGAYWSRPGHEGCYLLWPEGYEVTVEYRPDYDTDEVAVDVAVEMVEEALDALREGDDEDEDDTDDARPSNLHPEFLADGWCVSDDEGGVWWPSEEAQAEIRAAADPELTIVAMVQATPMRGVWHA